jgi:hypothetical protein
VAKNVRNVVIVLVVAALVQILPGGGTGANVAIQAVSLVFLASIAWVAMIMYREHRTTLYSLGDGRRAIAYSAVGVGALTLTASSRLWQTVGGKLLWLALLIGAAYAVGAIVWSARRY